MDKSVFVSYARKNNDFVVPLVKDLRANGLPLWFDQWDIPPGSKWPEEIEKGLKAATHLLIVLSPESVERPEVDNELQYAISTGKQIIPVLHKPCEVPYRIHAVQYVNFTQGDYTRAFDELLAVFENADLLPEGTAPKRTVTSPAHAQKTTEPEPKPEPEKPAGQSGGVNISGISGGSISIGGDVVGGDKISGNG